MAERFDATERLDSWKDIASYLGRNVRTAMRWELSKGLPVHRIPGGQRQAVFAWKYELDAWMGNEKSSTNEAIEAPEEIQADRFLESTKASKAELYQSSQPKTLAKPTRILHLFQPQSGMWITVAILLCAIGVYAIRGFEVSPEVKFTDMVQITGDGALKAGLVTDGKSLYFGEYQNSRIVLSAVSVTGGSVWRIPTPFDRVIPTDISPDHASLLSIVGVGPEEEGSLWIIPLTGGQPRQVGKVRSHTAVWSPDGTRIAFASKTGIYVTKNEGASSTLLQNFDAIPMTLRWSPDGSAIRTELRDPKSVTCSFWDLHLSSSKSDQVSALVPLQTGVAVSFSKSLTLDDGGRSFAAGGSLWKQNIVMLSKARRIWQSEFVLKSLKSPIEAVNDIVVDPTSKRIFAIALSAALQSGTDQRADLILFDPQLHEFRPFLPEIIAEYIDFSRDGNWIVYVRRPDRTLWVSHPDGSAARQLAFPKADFELPRWSPDGKQVAVMAELPNRPWRIFVSDVLDGKPREVSSGHSSQGAPTWSPDGKKLTYGDVECQETGTCAIHEIDVSTGHEFAIPESDGLGTSRWSPDGRNIAALNPITHEVLVYKVATQKWRKLMDGVNGNDLSWSADSRYLFASKPAGDQPEILRIEVADGKIERVVDLSDFAKLRGRIDTWFALAPTGSIIFSRELASNEIYALRYDDQ